VHPDPLHALTWTNLYDAQILNGKVAGLMLALTQMLSASEAVSRPGSPICEHVRAPIDLPDNLVTRVCSSSKHVMSQMI
jgi:hypothetical protein